MRDQQTFGQTSFRTPRENQRWLAAIGSLPESASFTCPGFGVVQLTFPPFELSDELAGQSVFGVMRPGGQFIADSVSEFTNPLTGLPYSRWYAAQFMANPAFFAINGPQAFREGQPCSVTQDYPALALVDISDRDVYPGDAVGPEIKSFVMSPKGRGFVVVDRDQASLHLTGIDPGYSPQYGAGSYKKNGKWYANTKSVGIIRSAGGAKQRLVWVRPGAYWNNPVNTMLSGEYRDTVSDPPTSPDAGKIIKLRPYQDNAYAEFGISSFGALGLGSASESVTTGRPMLLKLDFRATVLSLSPESLAANATWWLRLRNKKVSDGTTLQIMASNANANGPTPTMQGKIRYFPVWDDLAEKYVRPGSHTAEVATCSVIYPFLPGFTPEWSFDSNPTIDVEVKIEATATELPMLSYDLPFAMPTDLTHYMT